MSADPDRLDASGDDGAAAFDAERPRLLGLAYRMLGSMADAEDVVQEAWLRWAGTDRSGVDRPAAWLTTVTSRLAIDRLRQQQRRREDYVGPWLPDPVALELAADDGDAPGAAAELADSLSLGFLVLLDRLGPVERAVFLLAEVFGEPYAAIGEAVGKSPAACRQIAHRARAKVRDPDAVGRPAGDEDMAGLVSAIMAGDEERLLALLAPDVVMVSDGGPHQRAARHPVVGRDRVTRLLLGLARRAPADVDLSFAAVNGVSAFVVRSAEVSLVLTAELDGAGRVVAVRSVLNPDKLGRLDDPVTMR